MSQSLYDFTLGALEAELAYAPQADANRLFSARMATFYCRRLMALEANPKDGTARPPGDRSREANQTEGRDNG